MEENKKGKSLQRFPTVKTVVFCVLSFLLAAGGIALCMWWLIKPECLIGRVLLDRTPYESFFFRALSELIWRSVLFQLRMSLYSESSFRPLHWMSSFLPGIVVLFILLVLIFVVAMIIILIVSGVLSGVNRGKDGVKLKTLLNKIGLGWWIACGISYVVHWILQIPVTMYIFLGMFWTAVGIRGGFKFPGISRMVEMETCENCRIFGMLQKTTDYDELIKRDTHYISGDSYKTNGKESIDIRDSDGYKVGSLTYDTEEYHYTPGHYETTEHRKRGGYICCQACGYKKKWEDKYVK